MRAPPFPCSAFVRAAASALWLAALVTSPAALAQAQAQASPGPSATELPAGFVLTTVVWRGNQALPDEALAALAAPFVGRRVTLADLEALAAQATQAYRARGFFVAQALVPQQEIAAGRVEISVVEGRLGQLRVRVAADAPITEARVRAVLAALRPGEALHEASYERAMLLLSDLPGLQVQAGLEPGAEAGNTDLTVEVGAAAKRWQASVDVDNHGSRASGRERASATLRYASPLGIGDNLDARVMSSFSAQQTFGRLSYEAPLAANGLRGGVGVSRVGYELGDTYAALGATGTALVRDASFTYPLLRARTRNLFMRAAYESKALHDTTAAVGIDSDKHIDAASLSLNWEARDTLLGGGYVSAGATASFGRLAIRDALTRAVDQDPVNGHQTEGRYRKLALQASRLQSLFGRHNLYVALAGQWASRNLDASEKSALGGDRAVRAYPAGELLVDNGWLATVEWRYSASDDLVLALLFDAARGAQARLPNALDTANRRSLRGPGLGLSWNAPWGLTLRGSVAWPGAEPATSDGGSAGPRVLVQVRKAF